MKPFKGIRLRPARCWRKGTYRIVFPPMSKIDLSPIQSRNFMYLSPFISDCSLPVSVVVCIDNTVEWVLKLHFDAHETCRAIQVRPRLVEQDG